MSFKKPPELHELQYDALGASLVDNPHLPASQIPAQNKALNTSKTYVTGAINELLQTIENIRNLVQTSLSQQQAVLGDFISNPALISELQKIDATVLEAIIKLSKMPQPESTYEIWLALGNTGTKEDFLNSLKGEKGADGKDGVAAGTTATIEIGEVITGAAGTSAAVQNVGTDTNARLDFTIPRGEKGLVGDVNLPGKLGTEVINCSIENLQEAIDALPRFLNKDVIINVAEGTVDEQLTIRDFFGYGRLVIKADNSIYNAIEDAMSGPIGSTTHNFKNLVIKRNNNSGIYIGGFNFTTETSNTDYPSGVALDSQDDDIYLGAMFVSNNSTHIWLYQCNATGGVKTDTHNEGIIVAVNSGWVMLYQCTISNKYHALTSSWGSMVSSVYMMGSNNQIINTSSCGSMISLVTPTITGTTKNVYSSGGLVINKSGGAIGTY
jgi:hypothetical protein